MLVPIDAAQTLGLLIRAARKAQKLRLDDLAGSAGVGPVFVRDVERGKPTVQLGRTLRLLAELGVTLTADVPDDAAPAFERLQREGVRPVRPRRSGRATPPADAAAADRPPEGVASGGDVTNRTPPSDPGAAT